MRDPQAYTDHGRNDPRSPRQMEEHPYDFVSLPDHPARAGYVPHHSYPESPARRTGFLTLTYEVLTPLHIGSGVLETAEECGLEGGTLPVRGIERRLGRPVLPGSGWKGAVRARLEAITASRLGLAATSASEPSQKLPGPLRGGPRKHKVKVLDRRVTKDLHPRTRPVPERDLPDLDPAESLFGTMGYRGRVHPFEGVITGPPARQPLRIVPMESPAPHRLAQAGGARPGNGAEVLIDKVEGRKFYYDGKIVHERSNARDHNPGACEPIDYVPEGSEIRLDVLVESVTEAELGALLLGAGWGDDSGILRFGGYKPAGLGKVVLREREVVGQWREGLGTRAWKRRETPMDLKRAVTAARSQLIDAQALQELHTITTLRRP